MTKSKGGFFFNHFFSKGIPKTRFLEQTTQSNLYKSIGSSLLDYHRKEDSSLPTTFGEAKVCRRRLSPKAIGERGLAWQKTDRRRRWVSLRGRPIVDPSTMGSSLFDPVKRRTLLFPFAKSDWKEDLPLFDPIKRRTRLFLEGEEGSQDQSTSHRRWPPFKSSLFLTLTPTSYSDLKPELISPPREEASFAPFPFAAQ